MATPHINAPEGAFAKTVLMPGDPLRAKFIAETFLENAEMVTNVRNIFGFTGTYKGKKVSVMASGMGMPSIGIYSHELYTAYGVENIIRIGSAGAYSDRHKVGDVVLGECAVSESTYADCLNGDKSNTLFPTKKLNDTIMAKSEETGIPCSMTRIHSADVFYQAKTTWQNLQQTLGVDCVEMESFALFANAKHLGKGAACMLTISDSFVTGESMTAEERQNSFTNMMKLALEAAIAE